MCVAELEVQASVPVQSDVDIFQLYNLCLAVKALLNEELVRGDISVFGIPFKHGIVMTELIDEILVDLETCCWKAVELKTLHTKTVSSRTQKLTHEGQTVLYNVLLNDLVSRKKQPQKC